VQNLMKEGGGLETWEGVLVQVQRQGAGEPEGADVADEVRRKSPGRIPSCSGKVSICSPQAVG
jgi:hypothetical protein